MTGLHMIWYTFSHIMSWLQHLFSLMKQVVYPCIIPLGSNNQSFMKTVYVAMWPVSNTKCFMKKEYNGMWRVSSNKYFMKKWTYEYICIIMAWLQHLLYESQRERERDDLRVPISSSKCQELPASVVFTFGRYCPHWCPPTEIPGASPIGCRACWWMALYCILPSNIMVKKPGNYVWFSSYKQSVLVSFQICIHVHE